MTEQERTNARPGTVSIRITTVVYLAVIAALAVVVCVLATLLVSARGDIADRNARDAEYDKAEKVATEYAVGAATFNYQNVDAWLANLKRNASPQLSAKFDTMGPDIPKLLVPLKMVQTATPITAKVAKVDGAIYTVNVFLNVTPTNAQNPVGLQSTSTFNVTLDKNSGWQVTDVGGLDGALPLK
ncbi:hypothetical protein [Nocardia sp. NPDC052566]|uniref:hypothetical protein n=1 Tax=Nocardia sp. NPDC052566 TaxID=3364330 RepID=UPI0037CBDA6F